MKKLFRFFVLLPMYMALSSYLWQSYGYANFNIHEWDSVARGFTVTIVCFISSICAYFLYSDSKD